MNRYDTALGLNVHYITLESLTKLKRPSDIEENFIDLIEEVEELSGMKLKLNIEIGSKDSSKFQSSLASANLKADQLALQQQKDKWASK